MQDMIIKLLNTDMVVSLVIGAIVTYLVKWFATSQGASFKKYEGLLMTAIKAAEKLIPDDTPNKGAARADHAMKLFVEEYERVTGVSADQKVVEAAALAIPRIHALLESGGNLAPQNPQSGFTRIWTCLVLFLGLACVSFMTGCLSLSEKKIAAAGKIADSYYNSANVAELWRMTSSNNTGRVVFENFNEFVMNTPVPPKNIIPREPTFWEGAWDAVKTLGPWGALMYGIGGGGLGGGSHSTVNNYAAPATP